MSRTAWIIFITLCVGVLGGLILVSRGDKLDVEAIDFYQIQAPSEDNGNIGDHLIGEADAPVLIIEYGDYQCPGCQAAGPNLKAIAREYQDKGVALVFRNIPLTTIHPNAFAAAAAAEAAGLQGKFWEMHEQLYVAQTSWDRLGDQERTEAFVGYARSLELDVDQFREDLTSDAVKKKINFDSSLARKAGVTGTPTIYVNKELVSGLRVKDGELTTDPDGEYVWANQEDFVELVLKPALRDEGVPVE